MSNPVGLKSVFRLGSITLLMVFAQAAADTGTADVQNRGSSGEPQQAAFWIEDPHAHKSIKAQTGYPDTSLWNAQRIKDYEDSLLVNGDPPIGVLTIADIKVQIPIYNGSEDLNLDRGVGRIKGMAWLGETGNLGIAGHRDGVFRGLKDIQKGAEIESSQCLRSREIRSFIHRHCRYQRRFRAGTHAGENPHAGHLLSVLPRWACAATLHRDCQSD